MAPSRPAAIASMANFGPVTTSPPGKDVGLRGLIRHTVDLDGAVAVEGHGLGRDAAEVDALADGAR